MRHQRILERSSRTIVTAAKQQYVCRQCLAQARSRALHTTTSRNAEEEIPYWRRMINRVTPNIFGGRAREEEAEKAAKKREEIQLEAHKLFEAGEEKRQDIIEVDGQVYHFAQTYTTGTNSAYVPASSKDGMKTIGSEDWALDLHDDGTKYTSSIRSGKLHLSDRQWQALLRYLLVDAMIRHKHQQPQTDIFFSPSSWGIAQKTEFKVDRSTGAVELQFPNKEHESSIVKSYPSNAKHQLRDVKAALDRAVRSPTLEGRPIWFETPITNPAIKTSIVDRIVALTGQRISDMEASKAAVIGDLYRSLAKKSPPKRLAKTKQVGALRSAEVPNVTVYGSKRKSYHKDEDRGMWKLIEQELQSRGLPVPVKRRRDGSLPR